MPPEPHVTLLGPQRTPRLDQVVDSLGLQGPFATINAGWQEREPEDELLDTMLGGRSRNLRLWHRMQQLWDADPAFAEADRERRGVLEEMQQLYLLGLDHAMGAITGLYRHTPRNAWVMQTALEDTEHIVREMDARHLERVAEVHAEFWARTRPHDRPDLAEAREAIAHELSDEIARELHITLSTVKTHVGSLMAKLCVRNRVELAIWAYETHRVPPRR